MTLPRGVKKEATPFSMTLPRGGKKVATPSPMTLPGVWAVLAGSSSSSSLSSSPFCALGGRLRWAGSREKGEPSSREIPALPQKEPAPPLSLREEKKKKRQAKATPKGAGVLCRPPRLPPSSSFLFLSFSPSPHLSSLAGRRPRAPCPPFLPSSSSAGTMLRGPATLPAALSLLLATAGSLWPTPVGAQNGKERRPGGGGGEGRP